MKVILQSLNNRPYRDRERLIDSVSRSRPIRTYSVSTFISFSQDPCTELEVEREETDKKQNREE